ncbi:hypothetical protein IWQ60_004325 [Tieghemiomyces parasiticus]|uniref:chitin synthase n=1 Tax=Tieghemiomyces parasiticus TaxID=78921 RepID=A0A9W8A8F1_9FUNG|nr:hypothetical protein IWQ60_004325 [Tieghemiomyces parasiticus]
MGKRSTGRHADPLAAGVPCEDLSQLASSANDATLTQVLQQLATTGRPYVNVQPSVLVALNPAPGHALHNDTNLQFYTEQCYRGFDPQLRQPVAPHVYQTAARAYFHLRRLGQDQSIVLSGMAGSGKSQSYRHIISELCALATHAKKEQKSHTQLDNTLTVLEAFGNASALGSLNSTRFGMFQEIQFNERGRIIGAKTLTYSLERSRVTNVPAGERNFHIFYYLLQGSSAQERSTYQLHDAAHFRYMTPMADATKSRFSRTSYIETDTSDKSVKLEDLKTALRAVGLKSRLQTQMFQLLAGILHLGNIEFEEAASAQESASIRNPEVLATVASFLGVNAATLESTLMYKTRLVGSELCTVFLNLEAAERQRDTLARVLYSLMFTWLVESINKRSCHDQPANFIGILDQYGFQTGASLNRFENFCVNFANEKLHRYVLTDIMSDHSALNDELVCDGIPLPQVAYQPHVATADLLDGPQGLIAAARDFAASSGSSDPSQADAELYAAFTRAGAAHAAFSAGNPPAAAARNRRAAAGTFVVQHFVQPVSYSIEHFHAKNTETSLPADFVNLFRETGHNIFVNGLFNSTAVATEVHPSHQATVVAAQQSTRPTRRPTRKFTKRVPKSRVDEAGAAQADEALRRAHEASQAEAGTTVLSDLNGTLNDLFAAMDETKVWHVVHIRPAPIDSSGFDTEFVRQQVRALALPDVVRRRPVEFTIGFTFDEFVTRFAPLMVSLDGARSPLQRVEAMAAQWCWKANVNFAVGHSKVFFTEDTWKSVEDRLRQMEKGDRAADRASRFDGAAGMADPGVPGYAGDDSRSIISGYQDGTGSDQGLLGSAGDMRSPPLATPPRRFMGAAAGGAMGHNGYDSDAGSVAASDDEFLHGGGARRGFNNAGDEKSVYDSEAGDGPLIKNAGTGDLTKEAPGEEVAEEIVLTRTRRCWVIATWALTWWIPSFALSVCGRMKRPDIQMAWREKVAICLLIVLLWGVVLFYIVGFSLLLCPKQYVYSATDVGYHQGTTDMWVYVRGSVYDVSTLGNSQHGVVNGRAAATNDEILMFAGQDVNATFPVAIAAACPQLVPSSSDQYYTTFLEFDTTLEAPSFPYTHTAGRSGISTQLNDPQFYYKTAVPAMKRRRKGDVVWTREWIQHHRKKNGYRWGIINEEVFNLNQYFLTKSNHQASANAPGVFNYAFLDPRVEALFSSDSGSPLDLTEYWDTKVPKAVRDKTYSCLKNLFYVGRVDTRQDIKCTFPYYLLLASSILLVAVIAIKFLCALQLTPKRRPQLHDKFVICQVPCYTEGEEGLRRTIDSLAGLEYDDKHKLIFLIADGNIIGSGNDRPTPRIILDILGVDPKLDPEPMSFQSLGEGAKQHNMAKVYSGLYEFEGHVVPYIVVVKVGKPTERSRPGNRGKRDSQVLLMNFLNRVHFESEMSPLELEIFHQMKNIIGVHPSLYEYCLMVDADTEVLPDSLTRLIAVTVHDSRIIGLCGETRLANEDLSLTTMIQVYEYFISHHMAKAFESLFGSVTCLPGCFCMYRIRTIKGQPLIIHQDIIDAYSENRVDTLHKKNLLSLGEDRYLTTLMMKYFPSYKMKFTSDAQCKTIAPDKWSVLLSQRRRWINSTVHNLVELVFLPELCGFCCFSMRFVVFLDLFGTLAMPVTIAYLGYLLYLGISGTSDIGYVSLILLAAVYGLQALIFLVKRQWQHIGWMVIYILAIPLFSFFLPVYSFWHFDDFSWGNTRVVVGEKGKTQLYITDEGKFDPKSIPLKKWAQFEQEMWEGQSAGSHNSRPGSRAHSRGSNRPGSAMSQGGAGMVTGTPIASFPRPGSRADALSQYGAGGAAPISQYGGGGGGAPMSMMLPPTAVGGPMDIGLRPMSSASSHYGPPPTHGVGTAPRGSHYNSMMMPGSGDYRTSRAVPQMPPSGIDGGGGDYPGRPGSVASHYSHAGAAHHHPQSFYMPPPGGYDPTAAMPSDDEIVQEIRNILATADLMTITKKQVRERLNEYFRCDLTSRRELINSSIEMILQGRM